MKLLNGVNVVSLPVRDLAAARTFYGDALGLGKPWFDDERATETRARPGPSARRLPRPHRGRGDSSSSRIGARILKIGETRCW